MKKIICFIFLITTDISIAEELSKKLDALNIPDDHVTPLVSKDKLYIFNTRYSSLINRHEFGGQTSHNLTAPSHLSNQQYSVNYRYHLDSKWSFGLRYNEYNNELTSAGKKLFDEKKIAPDEDFAYKSQQVFATYNFIYGKLRWSQDTVVYFDQYISIGAGDISLASGETDHYLLDLGLAFWLGKQGSMRFGVRNEFYEQVLKAGNTSRHNAMAYLEIGYLFGEGDRI